MRKYFLCLFLALLVFSSNTIAVKLADLPEVMKPESIQKYGDEIFVLEISIKSILVYSAETFKLKLMLGSIGEGPGEFIYTPFLTKVAQDYVVLSSATKIIWYTREGKIIKEQVLPPGILVPSPIKDNFVIIKVDLDTKKREGVKSFHLVDAKYEPIKEFYRERHDANLTLPGDTGSEEFKLLFHYLKFFIYDDKIFIANSQKGFVIDVFDAEANKLYSIDLNDKIERVKTNDRYKEMAMEGFRLNYKDEYDRVKKSAYTIYEYFPPIRQFMIDDNKIYVTTYKMKGTDHELIILDIKGNILDKLFLPLMSEKIYRQSGEVDPITVYKGILYELIENEETEMWELHKTDLSTINK